MLDIRPGKKKSGVRLDLIFFIIKTTHVWRGDSLWGNFALGWRPGQPKGYG